MQPRLRLSNRPLSHSADWTFAASAESAHARFVTRQDDRVSNVGFQLASASRTRPASQGPTIPGYVSADLDQGAAQQGALGRYDLIAGAQPPQLLFDGSRRAVRCSVGGGTQADGTECAVCVAARAQPRSALLRGTRVGMSL